MQRKGITSTVIISILVLINLFVFFAMLFPGNVEDMFANADADLSEMGELSLLYVAIMGSIVLFFYGWMLAISLTHTICLIFTIRNRKSPLGVIRIINVILDICNIALIVTPILKIWVL